MCVENVSKDIVYLFFLEKLRKISPKIIKKV